MNDIDIKDIDHKKYHPLIQKAIDEIKDHHVVEDFFDKYDIDIDQIDDIPICFANIDVSARTDHGCIYLNIDLVKDDPDVENIAHYLVHEILHWAQQTTGTKPTKSSDEGDYLDNEHEVEAFQNQVEYIADVDGKQEAEDYVEQVVDHHDLKGKKRNKKKDELMDAIADRKFLMITLGK